MATSNHVTITADPDKSGLFANVKNDLSAACLEFVGTFVFLVLAFGGVQAATAMESTVTGIELVLYASTCFGFSLLISAWLFFRVTGGLFNPNVSLGLMLAGVIGPVRFVLYCVAQLAGSIAAAAVVLGLTPGPCSFNTSLSQGMNAAQGLFQEMFVTSFLVLAVLMLAVEKHLATPFAPVGIGLTLFVCELWTIHFTGGAVNTARAFGPAVVTGFPDSIHWIYWVGPFLGSILGAGFYAILKHYKYWTLNPGQESTDFEKSPPGPLRAALKKNRRPSTAGNTFNEYGTSQNGKSPDQRTV